MVTYSSAQLFVLLTVLALGHGEVDTTLEIAVDFNPCDWKMCGADEDCRVIDHSELLEIPVAACVKKNVRPTEAGIFNILYSEMVLIIFFAKLHYHHHHVVQQCDCK